MIDTDQVTANATTLGTHLARHALERGEARAFTFLRDGEEEEGYLTYGELWRRANVISNRLRMIGLTGKRAILIHPPGPEFIIAFCGCLLAGVTTVPLLPPATRRLLERAQAVADDCQAAVVLTTNEGMTHAEELADTRGIPLIATDGLADTGTSRASDVQPQDLALLQYTSGSTGKPKGVMVTNGNLLANSTLIGLAFGTRVGEVGVSWLPLLHDMGLIGSVVHVLHRGLHFVHLSPQSMIRRPLRWLQAVAKYRATISGGPDFAWRLLADRLCAKDVEDLDLSCWRVAYSGAEPVRASTLDRVAALLAHTRFQAEAFLPCYGLAEATLIVSGGPCGSPLRMESPDNVGELHCYIGCGAPLPSGAVAIVDPNRLVAMTDGQVGEIWVNGPHVAAGYWGREPASLATFHARLAGDERMWMRTGDLGFMRKGALFISGRIKDLMIVNGRKHHPEDVEATVQAHVDGCASGACAAFQIEEGDRTRLVLAVEQSGLLAGAEPLAALLSRVNAAVWCFHEIIVDDVIVVRSGRLPRTTSGKVQRSLVRTQHLAGVLGSRGGDA